MSKVKTYNVTGTSHYLKSLLKLAIKYPAYDMTKKELIDDGFENEYIYQYEFYPSKIELIPEPTNEYDPNAIKVIIDGELVGYVKSGSCKHLLKVISENRIEKIFAKIGGGKYKLLEYDDERYTLERGETDYYVSLNIIEKDK